MLGLIAAAIMSLVFIAIIWISISPSTSTQSDDPFGDDEDIPSLEEMEEGSRMVVTIADRDDPTRIAGTLVADEFTPIGQGRRRLVNPDAWIYTRDGRAIHVTSDTGVLLMPNPNEPPESGTLEGNVTINVHDTVDGANRSTPGAFDTGSDPTLIARFKDPVEFERRYLRLTSSGSFTIESDALDFWGADLTIMLNDVQNRVELIEVKQGERLVLRQRESTPITHTPEQHPGVRFTHASYTRVQDDTPGDEPTITPAPTPKPSPKRETPYHTTFDQDVRVELMGTGNVTADTLEIWSLMIDGSLPSTAVRDINFAEDTQTAPSPTPFETNDDPAEPEAGSPSPDIAEENGPRPTTESKRKPSTPATTPTPRLAPRTTDLNEGDVLITWEGPLVVKPIKADQPNPLLDDQLILALSADERVDFSAPDRGLSGHTKRLAYHATQGRLDLSADPTDPLSINVENSGAIETTSINADLARGIIAIEAQGTISSAPTPTDPMAQIGWNDRAQFTLHTQDDGTILQRLSGAAFEGAVLASRDDAVVNADTIIATLRPDGDPNTSLESIALTQGALRSDEGSLAGDEITIGFTQDITNLRVNPSTLSAKGAVVGSSTQGRIETQTLDALLARDLSGEVRVRRATATGPTDFLGENNTHANGTQLSVNTETNTIVIAGDNARAGQGGSVIRGDEIEINTRQRAANVTGPGTFDHDIMTDGVPTGGHLRVSWTQSMRFEDALGTIECAGDVEAISTPDAFTRDTLKAQRVEIELSPLPEADRIRDPFSETNEAPERQLLSARAFGRARAGTDPEPASVESRTYDPSDPDRAIGVLYLEGSEIIADNQAQTLNVPSAGTMLILDRDDSDDAPQTDSSVTPGPTGPGLTRMTWSGSLALNRASGNATILNNVQIRHKSLNTARVSDLIADRLDATFSVAQGSDPSDPASMGAVSLLRAHAQGRVRFIDANRTLLADDAIYNAENETLFASANDDRMVTLRDSNEPTPMSARTLLWDLTTDRIEIDAPSPVRAPAGARP